MPAAQLPDHPDCLNCGTELRGQYCANCGQRASNRLISLWELLRDAFGDLLELDSRLWRTVIPLLVRPGLLTHDYLIGRRARYMPPFRMYLVLSVVFFLVALFDPRDEMSLLFEAEPGPTAEEVEELEEPDRTTEEALERAQERVEELEAEGRLTPEQAEQVYTGIEFGDDGPRVTLDGDEGFDLDYDKETGECTVDGFDTIPEWLQRRLTERRLIATCERIGADRGKALGRQMLDNIPVALIVLLPLIALVLKGLYPLSRRYFVEHLLFFVHFHSFFFLILTLQILFSRLAGMLFVPEPITILIIVAASFYIPVYLYKAMRRVYEQGHLLTLTKYIVLFGAYIIGAAGTGAGAFLFALLSV
jgi:hypothetical protein